MEVRLTIPEYFAVQDREVEINEQLIKIIQTAKANNYGLMAEHMAVLNGFFFKIGQSYEYERAIRAIAGL